MIRRFVPSSKLRIALDTLAAQLAIDTISDKNIQRLLEFVNQIRDAQDVTTAIEAAYEFQHEFALISGHASIPLIFQSFRAPIFEYAGNVIVNSMG